MKIAALPWLALLALALAAPVHAQWTWRDANGQINASDRPPPKDIPERNILSRPQPAQAEARPAAAAPAADGASAPAEAMPAAALPPRALQDNELEARKRAAEQEQTAQRRAEEQRLAQRRSENCRLARNHITALESGQRLARTNDQGQREILDDKGRADELRRARDVVASDCR